MKKTILVIDACVRQEESRTRKLLTTALDTMKVQHPDWKFEVLDLNKMDLKYWTTDTLKARDELLMKGDYTAPVFQYGNQGSRWNCCGSAVLGSEYTGSAEGLH